VNDLVQLASTKLTAAHATVADSQQESSECQDADVNDGNRLTQKPTDTTSAQLNSIASCYSDSLSSAGRGDRSRPPNSVDNNAASVKSSAVVTETHVSTLPNCAAENDVLCSEEVAFSSCHTAQSHSAVSSPRLSVQSCNGLPLCLADTKHAKNVSGVNVTTSANSATPCVSSVMLSTSQLLSVKDASVVETCESSPVVKLLPASAADATGSDNVVKETSSLVSVVSPVTASALGTPEAGNFMPMQSSELPTNSVSTEMDIHNKLTLSSSEQLLVNTENASSSVVSGSKVSTRQLNHSTEVNKSSVLATSTSLNSAATDVTTTQGYVTANVTGSSLTSVMQQKKSKSNEPADDTTAVSMPKKRPHRRTSAEVPDSSESEEKRLKRAKLDESVVASSAATPLLVGSEDVSSAAKMTGITDTERITCYKTIGDRKELKSVIGRRTAEQLQRKTSLAQTTAVLSDVDSSKSNAVTAGGSTDESNGSGSSSPRKPARRVPLITVAAKLPLAPTVFTLRSRARLAQKDVSQSVSHDSVESQQHATQACIEEKNSSETGADGNLTQAATFKAVHSTDTDKSAGGISAVSQLNESAVTEAVQPRGPGAVQCNQSVKLQRRRKDHQSQKPDPDTTALTTGAAVTSRRETSKQRSATEDVNDKVDASGKPSEPTSVAVTSDNTSCSIKTQAVTVQPHDPDALQCNQSLKLQNHRKDRQSRLLQKPHPDTTALTTGATVTSKRETSKPRSAATADTNDKVDASGKPSEPVSVAVTSDNTSSSIKTQAVTASKPNSDTVAAVDGKTQVSGAGKRQSSIGTRSSTRRCGKSDSSETAASGSVRDNHETHPGKAGHDKTVSSTKGASQRVSSSAKSTASSRKKSEPVSESSKISDHKGQKVPQKDSVPCAVAEKTGSKVTEDVENNNRRKSECNNKQTGSSRGVSVEQCNKGKKQTDVISRDSVVVAASQPSNSADTPLVCKKPPASVAVSKNLSQGVDTNINNLPVDLRHAVVDTAAEAQVSMKSKPTTPKQPVLNVSFDVSLAAKTSSPLTELSASRRESVDLFDVAIAGTPAQYASADDSFDSALSSPFNVDMVQEGGDAACDDVACATADFVVPDNLAAESVDASLCGKCLVSRCVYLQFKFIAEKLI